MCFQRAKNPPGAGGSRFSGSNRQVIDDDDDIDPVGRVGRVGRSHRRGSLRPRSGGMCNGVHLGSAT